LGKQTTLDDFMFVCPWCNKVFKNKSGYSSHIASCKHAPALIQRIRSLRQELSRIREDRIMLENIAREIRHIQLQEDRRLEKPPLTYIA